jgi:Uma2 family endonuclease
MYTVISKEKTQLSPGTVVRMPASWQDYQQLSQQRGDSGLPRLKYRSGEVLLMSPLAQHGRDANLIADIVKAILDHQGQEYDAFTPITMDLPETAGIEPDYCFYIDHWQAVSGKKRINWEVDPPPDLIIEVDVTSYSDVNDYLPYRVPEIWLFKFNQLEIYGLNNGKYDLQLNSRYFRGLDLQDIVSQCLQVAYERNTSAAIRLLRQILNAG